MGCRTVFGFRGDVSDNIGYTDEGAIVYPAGHNVVLYQPDTKTQRLLPGTLESEGITAICISPNKRLLAVAERSEKAMVTVYDLQTLKRRKVLTSTDSGSKVRRAPVWLQQHMQASMEARHAGHVIAWHGPWLAATNGCIIMQNGDACILLADAGAGWLSEMRALANTAVVGRCSWHNRHLPCM